MFNEARRKLRAFFLVYSVHWHGSCLIISVSPKPLHHETQKKSKSRPIQRHQLFFAIGLVVVVFFTWQSIEWKSYEKSNFVNQLLNIDSEDEEEVTITKQIKPPPPPLAPKVINIFEDEEEIEETLIESSETDQDEIVEFENIEVEEDFDDLGVFFCYHRRCTYFS